MATDEQDLLVVKKSQQIRKQNNIMIDRIFANWGLLIGGVIVDPYAHQVLLALGRDCKMNSPIKNRRWAQPPVQGPFRPVKMAVRYLVARGALHRDDNGRVQPTELGREIIDAHKSMRIFMRKRRWRPSLNRA